jgi:hypothetical protein
MKEKNRVKVCKVCEKPFKATDCSKRKFCSKACADSWTYDRVPEKPVSKTA